MNKIARKIGVAVIALVTIVSVSGIAPAVAQTPAELQAQINTLMAQITALQAQLAVGAPATPAPVAVFNFTRNLTVGSTGEDVKALQQFLNAQGFAVAATGAGSAGNESTAFGPRTQAALARFQGANNISPALGFFGPVTRARIATVAPAPVAPVTPVAPVAPDAPAVEGTLSAELLPSPLGVRVAVNETNRAVAAFELEAKDSNIRVQRVDVLFDGSTGVTDERPWRAFNRVALSVGGEVVATRAITGRADFTEVDNAYVLRFSGINVNIPVGTKQTWTVQVSANPVIEETSRGTWTITVPVEGVRGIDGAGINQNAGVTTVRNFTVARETTGTLAVTLNANNLAERAVQVDDVDTTDGVQLLAFDVRATRSAVTMKEVDVNLAPTIVSGVTGANQSTVAPVARLYRGTTLVGSATVPATGVVEFENMESLIERDSTATFTVRVNLNRLVAGTTYGAGTTIRTGDVVVRGEDARDNTVVPVTLATAGNLAHLFTVAPSLALVGTPTISQVSVDGARRDASTQIVVDITALGGDVFIKATDGVLGGITGITTLLPSQVLATSLTLDGITLAQTMTSASITGAEVGTWGHIVREGTTRRFTVTGNLSRGGTAGSQFVGTAIPRIIWSTSSAGTDPQTSTFGLTAFETGRVLISN